MRLVGLVLVGCGSSAAPDAAPGTLVFVAEVDGAPRLASMPAAGGEVRFLGDSPSLPAAADPRGEVLAVWYAEAAAGHQEELQLWPRAGGVPRALAPRAEFVRNPAWTADGAAVVFESSAASFRDLYRVSRDGGVVERLTDAPGGSFDPSVSVDGTLALVSARDGDLELYAQPLAGGEVRRLTAAVGDDRRPSWRADGQRLAWLASRGSATRVWTCAPDGSDAAPLRAAPGGLEDVEFAWSPDGRRAVLVERRDASTLDLVVVDAVRGRELGRLTGGIHEHPAWSPDGRWIVYSGTHDGDRELYRVDADGAGSVRLTRRPGADWLPRWLPG